MKNKNLYVCQSCGYESSKWMGSCPKCNEWNTFEESVVSSLPAKSKINIEDIKVHNLNDITIQEGERFKTNIPELDRVLGGGFVDSQVVLISGTPGIGKSTLLLQVADSINNHVLYASGEESAMQIASRANRLGIDKNSIKILASNIIEEVTTYLSKNREVKFVILDSIQTFQTNQLNSRIGSSSQIKECTNTIVEFAKKNNVVFIVVGHITKAGDIAGPKLLEHMVDTVLLLEGDKQYLYRMLKAEKNRFGDTAEVGIFDMQQKGLISITNPGEYFATTGEEFLPGKAKAMYLEGNRPILLEVEALLVRTAFGYPRRVASGFNLNRLNLLAAVLEKSLNIDLSSHDIYLNIVSGLNVSEPGLDLAVCYAIFSSYNNIKLKDKTVFVGEVGLLGEVKKVAFEEKRIREAEKLGFKNVLSSNNLKNIKQISKLVN